MRMQAEKVNVAALIARLPDTDRPGTESTFTGPHPDEAKAILEELIAGGREAISALIDLVCDPRDPEYRDYRADYLLHCLALSLSGSGNEEMRRVLTELLASRLGGEKPSKLVQANLIRELQVAGGAEVAGQLGRQLHDDELCEPAAQALVAIRSGAAEEFRKALPGSRGMNRVTIVQALGVVRDAASVAALKEAAGEGNVEVRMAAVWALAKIGDPQAADVALAAAGVEHGWERIQATKACLILAEKLAAAGNKDGARRIYGHLRDSPTDPAEAYVKKAAEKALAEL